MADKISVLLVDDHSLVRRGFRRILEDESDIAVIAEAADGAEAIRLAAELQPKVVVMDCAMPRMNGLEATRQILSRQPQTLVLMLSMHPEETLVRQALDAIRASGLRQCIAVGGVTELEVSVIVVHHPHAQALEEAVPGDGELRVVVAVGGEVLTGDQVIDAVLHELDRPPADLASIAAIAITFPSTYFEPKLPPTYSGIRFSLLGATFTVLAMRLRVRVPNQLRRFAG